LRHAEEVTGNVAAVTLDRHSAGLIEELVVVASVEDLY
jgi:hypothetical protein